MTASIPLSCSSSSSQSSFSYLCSIVCSIRYLSSVSLLYAFPLLLNPLADPYTSITHFFSIVSSTHHWISLPLLPSIFHPLFFNRVRNPHSFSSKSSVSRVFSTVSSTHHSKSVSVIPSTFQPFPQLIHLSSFSLVLIRGRDSIRQGCVTSRS